jgi:hypothetical protein
MTLSLFSASSLKVQQFSKALEIWCDFENESTSTLQVGQVDDLRNHAVKQGSQKMCRHGIRQTGLQFGSQQISQSKSSIN